ncbi:hypothetical protein BDV38DRAFT_278686 [Aspergillus pseudotamarii]|uniref:Uncharacterized protein n=1 Tax=Aspergillus pseudotamarii TaxID=132259 RepID=A0A5N6T6G8_ASPPS|nr:uncharacterized protein BDV38DRAFT_278686 [Aspergillus pseudotamarii]KAE8141902.1 hypothetical protein BDV38DRAFT_278686 [Aspergillus pseudotamarii]
MPSYIEPGLHGLWHFLFPPTNRERGWLSWQLIPSVIILFTTLEIGLIVSIEVLLRLSQKNNGFVTVNLPDPSLVSADPFKQSHWTQKYLWTTIPTFIITLYKLCWTSIFTEFCIRQPFIEMAKPEGSRGKNTVLYESHSPFIAWAYAFKNGHLMLGSTILASFIALILPPLMSNLFSMGVISQSSPASMTVMTSFNDTAVDSRTNYQTVLNVVSAARIYGASLPPWTTEEYSFPTFAPISGKLTAAENSSLELAAFSANLGCRDMASSSQVINSSKGFMFSATDRGCRINMQTPATAGATVYMRTAYIGDCGSSAGFRRHVFLSALLADNSTSSAAPMLTNVSFISCTMEYYWTEGTLLVSSHGKHGSTPSIVSFKPTAEPETWLPTFWGSLEFMIHQINQFDPTGTYSSDGLGLLILAYSEQLAGLSGRLRTDILIQAIQDIYKSILSVSGSTLFFQPIQNASSPVAGRIYKPINRLFVEESTAHLMQGMLSFLTVWTVLVMIYSFFRRSILREEPLGLLGAAELIYGGDLNGIAAAYRNDKVKSKGIFQDFIDKNGYKDIRFKVTSDETERPIITVVKSGDSSSERSSVILNGP